MADQAVPAAESVATYGLFQRGDFTLHSGEKSGIKIDCDALSDADLETIAWLLAGRLPLFGKVEGVPTGGLRLAEAMGRYARPAQSGLLIVDDVLTSGGSMEEHRAGRNAFGAVIFARRTPPTWVTSLFTMTPYPVWRLPALIDGSAL